MVLFIGYILCHEESKYCALTSKLGPCGLCNHLICPHHFNKKGNLSTYKHISTPLLFIKMYELTGRLSGRVHMCKDLTSFLSRISDFNLKQIRRCDLFIFFLFYCKIYIWRYLPILLYMVIL